MVFNLQNLKVFLLFPIFVACSPCQFPDVPVNGFYAPMTLRRQYNPGDKIKYSCYQPHLLIGCEERICQNDGKWTDVTPFCDLPAKLKNPFGTTELNFASYSEKAIDGDTSSCFSTKLTTGQSFNVYLDKPATINLIILLLPKGHIKLEISLHGDGKKAVICDTVHRNLEKKQWLSIPCKQNPSNTHETTSIKVADISPSPNRVQICEMQVYTKSRIWCKDPPETFISNGWLLISRDTATLQCREGYDRGENIRLVCDQHGKWSQSLMQCDEKQCDHSQINDTAGGQWKTIKKFPKLSIGTLKKLTCHEGYKMVGKGPDTVECLSTGFWSFSSATCEKLKSSDSQINYKAIIIAVSTVVATIVVSCCVLVIFMMLKKKSKPIIVVVRQSDDGSIAYNEAEYSNITYESMPTLSLPKFPTPPRSRRPVQLEPTYSNTADPPPYNESQKYSEPVESQETKATNEIIFMKDLKESPLYGDE